MYSPTCLARKGITKTKSVGTLVSNLERRAAVVLLINRFRFFCQTEIVFPSWCIWALLRSCSPSVVQVICHRCPGKQDGQLSPWRTDRSASPSTWPSPAPPPRPWYVRVLDSTINGSGNEFMLRSTRRKQLHFGRKQRTIAQKQHSFCISLVESKTGTHPGRVGTGRRTAGRRGRAGTGSTGCRRDCSPRRNSPSYSPDDERMTSWVCLWKHERRKPYVNRRCFLKLFSCKACPGICSRTCLA